jgi:hypothetical protein
MVRATSFPIIHCVIDVVKIKLRIRRLLASSRKKCSCRVIYLVVCFPGPRATAVEDRVDLASAEGGESKGAIVLPNDVQTVVPASFDQQEGNERVTGVPVKARG